MLHQAIAAEVNRPLVSGFVLIWLEVGLYLMFILAIDTRGFKFPLCPCFCLPLYVGLPCVSLFRESVSCSSFNCNALLYWSPVGM